MGGAKRTTWIGGAAFVALVMVVASWFLAISPKLSDAADVRAQAQQARDQNDLLQLKLTQLQADFAKLDEYKAELATLQAQVPPDEQLAEYVRQLDAIATAHNVTVTSLTPAVPQAVVLAAAAAPAATTAPATTEGSDSSGDGAATDGTDPAATSATAATGVPVGFSAVPVQMNVVGTYDNGLAFLADLQNATNRLLLVTTLQATAQDDAEAGGGKPATSKGDVELVVGGNLYILPDALGTTVAVDPAAPAPTLPGAVGGKNPFAAITGH